ncbi:hypothetical protein [Pseudodesulfovibrio tunisiensis]|uniref:hypothetical protein n=1 Tax=Pseudodesulfovibrio tunisiensis TaxID=463192 RepID=UPI001FB23DE2|nr:hypothetical protein [Pseudodesulfovibrio tunisiensis]
MLFVCNLDSFHAFCLQSLLGHSEFRMTSDTYAHVADEDLLDLINAVDFGHVD